MSTTHTDIGRVSKLQASLYFLKMRMGNRFQPIIFPHQSQLVNLFIIFMQSARLETGHMCSQHETNGG